MCFNVSQTFGYDDDDEYLDVDDGGDDGTPVPYKTIVDI